MNRDTLKTLAGLLIIGVIVVATFLYGNAQRQNQLKHDAAVKQQQQQAAAAAGGVAKASPSGSAAPAASGTAAASPSKSASSNTAPVQSPGSSVIQGGSAASSAPKPSVSPQTPAPTPTQVATVPQTGGNGAPLPQTGPAQQLAGVLGLAGIVSMWLWVRRSRRAIFTAARNNR